MAQGWLKPIVTGLAAFFVLAFLLEPAAFGKANQREGSLGVIVEKDLFRPSRNKPRPPKAAPKSAQVVVLPPPKSPPPRLTLSGTILLDSGSEALMQSTLSGSGRYRVGDEIEGFVITDILGESVVLKRDDEVLKVYMNSVQGGFQNASGFSQARQNIAVQSSGAPSDIPPALVPRPQSPFQRAPYRQNTGNR